MGVILYDSKPGAGNICLPTSKYLQKTLMKYLPTSKTLDLVNSWPILLICLGTSIMIGIVFMLLMRWNEGCVVWTLMYAGIAVLFILGVLLVWPKEMTSRGVRVLEIILGVVCFLLTIVIVMVMGYRWRDVEAWGRLMHTANKLIASDQLTFSFPLTMSIISLLLLLLWLTIGFAFSSTGSYHL
jgi:NADH:ubiquinone oxidoreductase subunit 6 (subunit J)